MGNTILNQWSRNNCWVFAMMAVLINKWVNIDIARLSELKAPYYPQLENLFIKEGLITKMIPINTTRLVDYWLKRWEWLITSTSRGDFSINNNQWGMIEFDEKSQHFFVICEDCWDKWKIVNSWGTQWGQEWYWYMKKSDFSKLFTPRRIVANKNIWV